MAAGSGTAQHGGPSGTSDRARVLAAIAKWGPSIDAMARKRYGISGQALLAKLGEGESGAISDPTAARTKTSSAGAKAWTQFTAGSRAEAIKKFGIDPWASPDQAFHATVLHLEGKINGSTGLEGYNPGMPTYKDYILGQKVGDIHGATAGRGVSTAGSAGGGAAATDAAASTGLSQSFDAGQGSLSSLLQGVQQQQAPVISGSLPQLPSFAAAPSVPQGFQVPSSGGGPAPAPEVQLPTPADLTLSGQTGQTGTGAPTASAASTGEAATSSGRVKGFKAGDPVIGGTSIGGEHETMGLAGYPARDYFAKAGSTAVAPVSGKVVKLSGHDPKNGPTNGPHGPLGWSVYIKGTDGRTYFLTHMGSRSVKVGEKVSAGAAIGTVANYDKYGTPSHIHMGVSGG